MADEEIEQKPYTLLTDQGEQLQGSYNFSGNGTAEYPTGDRYEGQFLAGKRQGKGTYTYANGDVYTGKFENNSKNGIGKLVYANNAGQYHGYFSNGSRQGEGLFHYANKDRYSGSWKSDKKHGYGTYIIDSDNIKLAGEWFEGQLLHGSWTMSNGDKYEGEFKYNKPNGKGVWNLANGNQVIGLYNQNFLDLDSLNNDNPTDPTTGKKIELEWTTHHISKPMILPNRFNDQERAKYRQVFNKFDKDNSGQIDTHELKLALNRMGTEMDEDQIQEIIQGLDIDGTGTLSFGEFLEFVYRSSDR